MRTEKALKLEINRLRKISSDRRLPEATRTRAFEKMLALQWALGAGSKAESPSALMFDIHGAAI